jgi:hypothetical protein
MVCIVPSFSTTKPLPKTPSAILIPKNTSGWHPPLKRNQEDLAPISKEPSISPSNFKIHFWSNSHMVEFSLEKGARGI